MFIVRRAKVEDSDTLLKLARMVHFINLPPDRDIIHEKILHSRRSFMRIGRNEKPKSLVAGRVRGGPGLAATLLASDLFMFVLEDTEHHSPVGSSQLVSRMGGPDRPNIRFKLDRREMFSQDLQTGTSHAVATLDLDYSSPTEIGGLILQPSFRGHKLKLGRFLALVRFHFIGLHRKLFADRVLAEMMANISPEGHNTFWDYLGRRFIPLSYDEADRFCQHSHEFMLSLLPTEPLYLSLLPPIARAGVGQVGPETVPARRMLEKLGFRYRDYVDPFDGGPHIDCATDDISVVQDTRWGTLGKPKPRKDCTHRGIVSVLDSDGEFRAVNDQFAIGSGDVISLSKDVQEALGASAGANIGYTPMDGPEIPRTRNRKKAKTKKAAKS